MLQARTKHKHQPTPKTVTPLDEFLGIVQLLLAIIDLGSFQFHVRSKVLSLHQDQKLVDYLTCTVTAHYTYNKKEQESYLQELGDLEESVAKSLLVNHGVVHIAFMCTAIDQRQQLVRGMRQQCSPFRYLRSLFCFVLYV